MPPRLFTRLRHSLPLIALAGALSLSLNAPARAATPQETRPPTTPRPTPSARFQFPVEGFDGLLQMRGEDLWIIAPDLERKIPARLRLTRGSVEASHLIFFPREQAVYAEGLVRLRLPGLFMRAESLYYDLKRGRGSAQSVYIHTTRQVLQALAPGALGFEFRFQRQKIEQIVLRAASADWVLADAGARARPVRQPTDGQAARDTNPEPALIGALRAHDVTLSPSEMPNPEFKIHCRQLDLIFDEKGPRFLSTHGGRLIIYGAPVIGLGRVTYDLRYPSGITGLALALRDSREWGFTTLMHLGWGLGRWNPGPFDVRSLEAELDYRELRGWAGGARAHYRTGRTGSGTVRLYYLEESLIDDADDDNRAGRNAAHRLSKVQDPSALTRQYESNLLFDERRRLEGLGAPVLAAGIPRAPYADESRFALEGRHRSTWLWPAETTVPARLDFWLDLNLYGDRDYRQEYEESAFKSDPDPPTQALVRYYHNDFAAELTGLWRVNDFHTRTEYLPELRLGVPGRPVPGGFLLAGELRFGHLRRRFDDLVNVVDAGGNMGLYDVGSGFETNRAHAFMQLSRPLRLGPLSVNPFVATQQTYYADSREDLARNPDGGDVHQSVMIQGVEVSTRIYGRFAVNNSAGSVTRYRHIIEPRVRFLNVDKPQYSMTDAADFGEVHLLDFDEVEDTKEQEVLTFSLDQKLQVRRASKGGAARVIDLAALELSLDKFTSREVAKRLNDGKDFDLLRVAAFYQPAPVLRLSANSRWNVHGDGWEELVGAVRLRGKQGAWHAAVGMRAVPDIPSQGINESTAVSLSLAFPLSRRWHLSLSTGGELEPGKLRVKRGFSDVRGVLTRMFHDWQIRAQFNYDEQEDDLAVSITIRPRGSFRHLRRGDGGPVGVGSPGPSADGSASGPDPRRQLPE